MCIQGVRVTVREGGSDLGSKRAMAKEKVSKSGGEGARVGECTGMCIMSEHAHA